MKMTVKSNPSYQFVSVHRNPTNAAFADTKVILSAYLEALYALLSITLQEEESEHVFSDHVVGGMYQNYLALQQMRAEIVADLEKADVVLEAISARLVT